MFCRVPRLTPGYIRLLQTQAYHVISTPPPASKTMPGMAMLMGAVGFAMCGYSSRQLALYHRPSTRVQQLVGTYTDASMMGAATHRTPLLDAAPLVATHQEIPPCSFVGQKLI